MKKRFIGIAASLAIATLFAFNLNISADDSNFSALTMDNIEALASGESGGNKCYRTITSKEGSQVMYCQTCTWISGTYAWSSSTGTC